MTTLGQEVANLTNGRILQLRSRCTGLNLQVTDEKTMTVNGKGVNGVDVSRWVVRVAASDGGHHTIQLESYKYPGKFLRISADKKLDAAGHKDGEYTFFRVLQGNDGKHFALYSKSHHETHKHGQYFVAVSPESYEAKDPTKTTTLSNHAMWRATYEPNFEWRNGGKIVCLQSLATGIPGKTLCINDDSKTFGCHARGTDNGKLSQWKVKVAGHELFQQPLVQLESNQFPGQHLRISADLKVDASGGSTDEYTYFHVDPHADGTISLRSMAHNIKYESLFHVGALPDGSIKSPQETGTGIHGRWLAIWLN